MRVRHVLPSFALCLFGAAAVQAQVFSSSFALSGAEEVPPTGSTATGSGTAFVDTAANTLTLSYTFSGLSSAQTDAHIHGFVGPGVDGGVLHALPPGNVTNDVWNYLQADEANILAGLTYVNIHSSNFGGGEIRGQIDEFQVVPEPTGLAALAAFTVLTMRRRRR